MQFFIFKSLVDCDVNFLLFSGILYYFNETQKLGILKLQKL